MGERAHCAMCGEHDTEFLFVGRDRLHRLSGEFDVVRCRRCGQVYLSPPPTWDQLQKFYPVDYAGHSFGDGSPVTQLIRRGGLHKKRQLVQRRKPGGVLLDVGCGTGDFLQLMSQDANWECFGVEPVAEAARYADRIKGVQVFGGRVEDVEYPPRSLDVVTMWHVLEHLCKPREALTTLRRALKPDGVLIMAVPVLDSLDARLFGQYWSGYDVPRHVFTYSIRTLSAILSCTGFSPVEFDSFVGGYDAFRISLGFWAEERVKSRLLLGVVRAVSQNAVSRLLMVPYFAVVNLLGCGSTVVAIAEPAERSS